MARGRYGDGTIYQRKDGKWVGQFDAGYTTTGNRRRKTVTADTKTAAAKKLRDALRAYNSGEDTTAKPRTSVKVWANQWLALRADTIRPASYAADRSAITQWVIPTIGKRSLDALTPADIRRVHKAMRDAGRADSSITRAHSTLIKMLKDAWQDGHQVPARALQAPPPATGTSERTDIPVEDAISLIQAAAEDPLRSRWVAALMQGMRQAECMGLTWDHVDFDAETIDVSYQLKALPYEHGCGGTCGKRFGGNCPDRRFRVPRGYRHEQITGRWHLVPPKTRAGERVIPMLPWMKAALLDVAGHDVVVTALGMKKRAPDRHDGWCLDIRRPGGDPFHDPP